MGHITSEMFMELGVVGKIESTLDQFKEIRKDKRYVLDRQVWHNYNPKTEKCLVCFAGSILTKWIRHDMSFHESYLFKDKKLKESLMMLDMFQKIAELKMYNINMSSNLYLRDLEKVFKKTAMEQSVLDFIQEPCKRKYRQGHQISLRLG